MRILIDLQGAQTESRFRGIGRYALALTKEIAGQADLHNIWLVLNGNFPDTVEAIRGEFSGLVPQDRIVTFRTPVPVSNDLKNAWRMQTAELLRETFFSALEPDIVYITSLIEGWTDDAVTSIGLLETASKTAVTHYDLIPFINPKKYLIDQPTRDYYLRKIESLKKADLLLSISEHSRREAIELLHLPPERVVNVSAAANLIFRPVEMHNDKLQSLFMRYGITRPFIMYTGGFDPRKNLPKLLVAFSSLPAHIRNHHQLLIAGKASQSMQAWLKRQATRFGMDQQIVIADFIPDEDLVGLYNTCTLFVLPSLHEGFGLPALEAMACGAPAIGSNTTSIPEVIGYKDALFDPTNEKDIAEKMLKVITDEGLRKFLREHGLQQSRKFSWQMSARRVLDAFEMISPKPASKQSASLHMAKQRSRKLIAEIGIIPRHNSGITSQDLVETAQCVWENEKTIDWAVRQRWS